MLPTPSQAKVSAKEFEGIPVCVAGVVSSVYIASPLFPAVSGLLAIPGIPNFAAASAAAEEEDDE